LFFNAGDGPAADTLAVRLTDEPGDGKDDASAGDAPQDAPADQDALSPAEAETAPDQEQAAA
jgi:hypothetical protein